MPRRVVLTWEHLEPHHPLEMTQSREPQGWSEKENTRQDTSAGEKLRVIGKGGSGTEFSTENTEEDRWFPLLWRDYPLPRSVPGPVLGSLDMADGHTNWVPTLTGLLV